MSATLSCLLHKDVYKRQVFCGGHWGAAASGNRGGKESERSAGFGGVHEVPPGSLRDRPRGGAAGEQPQPFHGGPLPRGLQGHHPRRGCLLYTST